MSTVAERVARGARYLDMYDPDWWRPDVPNAIDLDTLDLGDTNDCILGQRCPLENPESRYGEQLRRIVEGGQHTASDVLEVWAAENGFTTSPYARAHHYHALTTEWRDLISKRRAAGRRATA